MEAMRRTLAAHSAPTARGREPLRRAGSPCPGGAVSTGAARIAVAEKAGNRRTDGGSAPAGCGTGIAPLSRSQRPPSGRSFSAMHLSKKLVALVIVIVGAVAGSAAFAAIPD